MPRTIRRALYEKLRKLPELVEFQRDFELLSGMKLAFVNELGLGDDLRLDQLPLCAAMKASEAGRAMCARSRSALLAGTGDHSSCALCGAGLIEAAIPLSISGIKAGYFIFGGRAPQAPDGKTLKKTRSHLKKNGIDIKGGELETLLSHTAVLPSENLEAYKRIVHLAARYIALKVTDQIVDTEAGMPPSVVKAC